MKQETIKTAGDIAVGLGITTAAGTSAGTWLDFLNNNAPAIGLFMAFFFGVAGLILQFISTRGEMQASKNAEQIKKIEALINNLADKHED